MNDNQKFNKLNAIISIVIAFIAWVFVVYNYSPMKNVTYTDVPIKYVGLDTLANRGYAIESSSRDSVDVVVAVQRKHFSDFTSEDITVEADVASAIEGENGISLTVETPGEAKLKKLKQRSISINVRPCATKDVPLVAVYSRNLGNGTEPIAKSISYRNVSIVGIPENVEKVKYAIIQVSAEDIDSNARSFVLTPIAVDQKGKKVSHILVLPSEISASLLIGETKEVSLDIEVNNVPNGVLYSAPGTIMIKGTADILKDIDKIEAQPVDLSEVKENTTISINYILPEGVSIAQASAGKGIIVTKEK